MSKMNFDSRRVFLKTLGIATSALILPTPLVSGIDHEPLSFGVVADVHADLIPDRMERLEKFIEKAISRDVDFIVQLGDFCFPKKVNLEFLKLWNQFKKPKYHLLGNHDMDTSSKEETMAFLGMRKAYYSFDQTGIHFVVLDPNYLYQDNNYIHYKNANFYVDDSIRTYINDEQIEWLGDDLQATQLQTIILSHQSLINPSWGVKNRVQIQELLEQENQRAGFQKVIACLNGHDHIDFQRTVNGIHYIEINSMSYQWLGAKYSNISRFPASFYEDYGQLDKLAPYKDSLFAFLEIDIKAGKISIEGVESDWLAPSPDDLNVPNRGYGMENSASISDRVLSIL